MIDVFVVMVVRDFGQHLGNLVERIRDPVHGCPGAPMIIVDMGSEDITADIIADVLVVHADIDYLCLSDVSQTDAAYLAGMENVTPGSAAILFDPTQDDPTLLASMATAIRGGDDLVVAIPSGTRSRSLPYRLLSAGLRTIFRASGNGDIRVLASRYRGLSPRALSYVTQHANASLGHARLPFMARFRTRTLVQDGEPALKPQGRPSLMAGFRKAVSLANAGSRTPLRMTSGLCLTAAMFSLLSSAYVSATYIFVDGVAPGWTTLSLQMNGMFFLVSIALAVMSEYVLSLRASGMPSYHVASSACSTLMRRRRPNVDMPQRRDKQGDITPQR